MMTRYTILFLFLVSATLSASTSTYDSLRTSIERRSLKEQFEAMEHYADSLVNVNPYAAIPFTQEAVRIAHAMGDKNEEGYLLNSLSKEYLALGEFDKSGEYARQALTLNIETHHDYEIARTYNITAVTYTYMGLYTNAMEYSLKALSIYSRLGKKNQAAYMLNAIGAIYLKMAAYDKAEDYFRRSLKTTAKKDTTKFSLLVLNNLASIQSRRGHPDSALHQFESLLALARKRNETGTEAYTLYLMGEAYCAKHEYDRALALFRQSRELSTRNHEGHGVAEAILGTARAFSGMGRHRRVIATLNEAIPCCRQVQAFDLLRAALDLQRTSHEKLGNLRLAYESLRAYTALTDSVFTIAEKFGITTAKFTTELSQKEGEIQQLRRDAEMVEASNEKKEYLIYALGVIVLIMVAAAVGLMFMYRNSKHLHKIETEQKQKIESLFTELSKVVNDRDLADEQAQDVQRKFQAVWEKSIDGMRLTDKDGKIQMVNEAFCRMVDMGREELTGQPISALYRPGARERIMGDYRENFAKGNIEQYFEREIILRDNRSAWFEVTNTFIEIEGQPLLLLSIFRDITHRKRLEHQLVQSQKLEGIGTLAGGIAHDFNNLLAMILGSAEMLKGQIAALPQLRKYVDRIVEASMRGTSISRQLLIFSRPDQAEFGPISLAQTVGTFNEMLTHFLPKSIQIAVRIETEADTIMGDAGQIQQALLNLAINAGDAMGNRGALTFGIREIEGKFVRSRFAQADLQPYLALTVRDTGAGMNEDVMQKIFDPFFTTKERTKGTGLGLSSVHGIVKNHGGFIDVESSPGAGTEFTLYFPAALRATDMPGDQRHPEQSVHPATVLLVDDEHIIRETVAEYMTECGYTVHSAEGGKEAIELFKKYRDSVDIVVTDLGMPVMGGEELFRHLRSIDPDVKVIVSSGYLDGTTKDELLKMGVRDVLTKPVKIHDIQMSISAVLARAPLSHDE